MPASKCVIESQGIIVKIAVRPVVVFASLSAPSWLPWSAGLKEKPFGLTNSSV